MDFQATLFEAPTLDDPAGGFDYTDLSRRELGSGAWVDVARGWLPDADDVFRVVRDDVPWRIEQRQMYDRLVDIPRLIYTYMIGEDLPHPVLNAAKESLSEHYLPELGEVFRTAGCCYYRDGRDSVAWHGDTIGRGSTHDTMVAIVSLGDPRKLALRPRGGGSSISIEMGHGDLVVMGGTCQRTWEHAVPKVSKAGPRASVQFRPFNVF